MDRPHAPNVVAADELEASLRRPIFNAWLGLRLKELAEDSITVSMPGRPEIVSSPEGRYVHGGVLAALLDAAAYYALEAKLGRGSPSVDLQIDYLRSAPEGPLEAQARVVKLGTRLSVVEARIVREDGKLVATGRVAFLVSEPARDP